MGQSAGTSRIIPFDNGSVLEIVAHKLDDEIVIESQSESQYLEPLTIQGVVPSSPEWRIVRPLPIEISFEDDGSILIVDLVFHEYGIGETLAEARNELLENLLMYYKIMLQYTNEKRLANQAILSELEDYIAYVAE